MDCDQEGRAVFAGLADGDLQIVVRSKGTRSLRRSLRMAPATERIERFTLQR
jgi:hypothetical protein